MMMKKKENSLKIFKKIRKYLIMGEKKNLMMWMFKVSKAK